jgi:hypothetical protein
VNSVVLFALEKMKTLTIYFLIVRSQAKCGLKFINGSNVNFIPFEECWKHFNKFGSLVKKKNYENGRHLIWLETIWSLRLMRNNIMFREDLLNDAFLNCKG